MDKNKWLSLIGAVLPFVLNFIPNGTKFVPYIPDIVNAIKTQEVTNKPGLEKKAAVINTFDTVLPEGSDKQDLANVIDATVKATNAIASHQ